MQKIVEIMGMPSKDRWPLLTAMPEYPQLSSLVAGNAARYARSQGGDGLDRWYHQTLNNNQFPVNPGPDTPGTEGLALLKQLLEYDPQKRLTAEKALEHPYFAVDGAKPSDDCFKNSKIKYPVRRVSQEDNDIRTGSLPGTKRSGLPDDSIVGRPAKRLKEG
jgi:cyclin-dependent kinase 8/11